MADGEFLAESPGVAGDAEDAPAVGEDGLKLRIALRAPGHVGHGLAGGATARVIARAVLRAAPPVQCLPALHEAVGAGAGTGAKLGVELQGADRAAELSLGGVPREARIG
ncbi:hypothetical protein [Palleronia rufa]|uniref:hypothetical protein n=1 Tax=Palleronia rufa TaxID=1530186 RepID=UPI0005657335|nr:hypothetical protein [Palleronia rufa]